MSTERLCGLLIQHADQQQQNSKLNLRTRLHQKRFARLSILVFRP
jgi:hypothetical protein